VPPRAEDLAADARAFDELEKVLDGKRRTRLDDRSSKMLRVLLSGDTDAEITSAQFTVHFGPQRRRKPSTYFRRLAASALSELLARAGCLAHVLGAVWLQRVIENSSKCSFASVAVGRSIYSPESRCYSVGYAVYV
jgi:hypothetical protein